MNNYILKNITLFISLVLVQVLILNNISLFGYLTPYIYILFVFLYPLRKNKGNFLFLSFLLGLSIDFFSNSGGINAAATLFIAYIRLPLLTKILNKYDLDYQSFTIQSASYLKSFTLILILTTIHHFILFSLEYFSFNDFGYLITKIFFNSILSSIAIFIIVFLLSKKK